MPRNNETHATSNNLADQVGIACPVCGGHNNRVINTRSHAGHRIRSRRCMSCRKTFTTAELVIDKSMHQIVVNGAAYKVTDVRET